VVERDGLQNRLRKHTWVRIPLLTPILLRNSEVECLVVNQRVVGSSPTEGAILSRNSVWLEFFPDKEAVVGSNPTETTIS
jgi:hypothetical protein